MREGGGSTKKFFDLLGYFFFFGLLGERQFFNQKILSGI
jgi:hypothetical protein